MTDLNLLEGLLQQATAGNPADETPQELFDQIVALVEQDKIDDAAGLIEKAFAKGIPDIRLIVYYYYAHFNNCGVKAFADILPGISSIVNQHWNEIKPIDRKDKHVQNSLNWFFSQALDRLKYSEKLYLSGKSHPLWEKSVNGMTPHELGDLAITAQNFQDFFVQQWPKSPTKDRIMHLVKKIEDLKSVVKSEEENAASGENLEEKQEAEPKEGVVSGAEKFEEENAASGESSQEKQEAEPKQEAVSRTENIEEGVQDLEQEEPWEYPDAGAAELNEEELAAFEGIQEIEQTVEAVKEPVLVKTEESSPILSSISPDEKALFLEELEVFSRKLKVFELLISQNDYLKAAVVARDIDQLIDNFDPLSYFPKLFGKYFSIVAKNVVGLSDQHEKKESLQVKSLEKLYRTDLDMFIDW